MEPDVPQLRALVALAETRSFTDAAAELGVSQASVSRAIARLERAVGTPLVHRTTRRVTATPAGVEFTAVARRVLRTLDAAVSAARGDTTSIRIGYAWAALGRHTTPALRSWNRAHPREPLRMVRRNTRGAGLAEGLVDLAVIRHRPIDRPLDSVVIGSESRWAAVAADSPLADRASTTLGELRSERVAVDRQTGTTSEALWADAGITPGPEIVPTTDIDDWLDLIAAGEAVGVTAEAATYHHPRPGVVYLPIEAAPPIEVRVAWHPENRHPATERVIRHLAAAYADAAAASLPMSAEAPNLEG